jgi:hypothetical protein
LHKKLNVNDTDSPRPETKRLDRARQLRRLRFVIVMRIPLDNIWGGAQKWVLTFLFVYERRSLGVQHLR